MLAIAKGKRKIIDNCKIKRVLLDVVFPRFCVNCGKEGEFICKDCSLFLSEASLICPACEKSSYFGERHKKCVKKNMPEGLVSAWDYEGIAKTGVHAAKYGSHISHTLDDLMDYFFVRIENNKSRLSLFLDFILQKETVITFVPNHIRQKRVRGFEQGEVVAKNLADKFNKETIKLLCKKKKTTSQTELNREERRENVKGMFEMCEGISIPERIVLVDDVWTSGATMRECCKVLKKSGAKEVWGFTLAKTA